MDIYGSCYYTGERTGVLTLWIGSRLHKCRVPVSTFVFAGGENTYLRFMAPMATNLLKRACEVSSTATGTDV